MVCNNCFDFHILFFKIKLNIKTCFRLTAFVAKSFYHAKKYIDIEKQIIFDALQWLADKQDVNGSFPEVGKVSHQDMQGGAAKGLALTAYTLITFLENKVNKKKKTF